MTRRPGTIDQFLGVGGSDNVNASKNLTEEALQLGQPISGQTGSTATFSAFDGTKVTITGISGMTADSAGRFLTISGAATGANNGTFLVTDFISASSVQFENTSAVLADANNGSIGWLERDPYTLEDDINFIRTDRENIKGTTYESNVPTYRRPSDTLVDVDTNLANVASKTLDAHAWLESRHLENVSVNTGNSFITITDSGNLKHAASTNVLGVPITDGYDSGNEIAAFVEIVDAEIDGYGDGATLKVLSGPNQGNRIFGLTRAGSSTSPNSVEIEFYSTPVNDWDLSSRVAYTWESGQPSTINVCYAYRQRLDLFDENANRATLIKGALSDTAGAGGGGGSGITEGTHESLRQLIHFIDDGPTSGFATGAFKEILPAGSPFHTSEVWYTSVTKVDKIVELTIIRNSRQQPVSETRQMYDTDGSTVIETVTDTITYSGPFELSRTRSIS